VITFKVGDLLIREHDKRPCLVLEVGESAKKEWGTLHANRRIYKLFESHSGKSSWVVDTEIKANYSLPPP